MPLLPILRKSPFSRLVFLYAAGIVFAEYSRNFSFPVAALFVVVIIIWLILWLVNSGRRNFNTGWIAGIVVAVLIFTCGMMAAEIDLQREKRAGLFPEYDLLYRVRIIEIPEAGSGHVKALARVSALKMPGGWIHPHMKVLLYISADSGVSLPLPGSELMLKSALKNIPAPANPDEFDYRRYLAIRHIYKQSFITLKHPVRDPVGVSPCRMRNRLLGSFRELGLEPPFYGLVSALTLGYKEDVDASTRHAFTQAGVMHIMALSGFNVGIIALVLGYMLGIFDRNPAGKFVKTLVIVLFIWLFAVVTGLSPSVTRATAMISLVLTGRLFNRKVNTYNILFVSAFVLLTFSPGMISDVSFQLSFAAVTGILVYQPLMNKLFTFKRSFVNKIWQLFTLSCAAQLATFPLTIFYFHQFPVYFWITNLYVVPLVSVIICISGGYLALAWITPAAFLTGKVLAVLLKVLLLSVTIVEKLPFSLISGMYISGLQAAILMVAFFLLAVIIQFKRAGLYPILLMLMIVFEMIHIHHKNQIARQHTGMVSSVKGTKVINLISGKSAIVLVTEGKPPGGNDLDYAFGNYWIKHGVSPPVLFSDSLDQDLCNGMTIPGFYCRPGWRGNNMLITLNEQRLVLLRDDRFYRFHSAQPLQADIIVITGGMAVHPDKIRNEIESRLMIIDASLMKPGKRQWR